ERVLGHQVRLRPGAAGRPDDRRRGEPRAAQDEVRRVRRHGAVGVGRRCRAAFGAVPARRRRRSAAGHEGPVNPGELRFRPPLVDSLAGRRRKARRPDRLESRAGDRRHVRIRYHPLPRRTQAREPAARGSATRGARTPLGPSAGSRYPATQQGVAGAAATLRVLPERLHLNARPADPGVDDMPTSLAAPHEVPADAPEASPIVSEPEQLELKVVARLYGEPMVQLPQDLYIPPDALEVFLEAFEGPLDVLLYLIRRQNFNILDIPMAEVTRQYLAYIDEIRSRNLELAAEYLLMAALLISIKSRMLLPMKKADSGEEVEDPRAELARRLIEYERIKFGAQQLDAVPQVGRDFLRAQVWIEQA